jgi:hypothetical protein
MGKPPAIKVYRMSEDTQDQLDVPLREMQCSDFPERINMAKFGAFNETIISVDG